ncbi:hypothetical protein EVAR_71693_1 [Eumeta japonica]|uniref:Uncharacterized protein n=1 Tax=Eumeta variegata TaxID=151549 RepID=A0A4C1TRQ6_EUMVA|nr:hypothetical protein EVAR_71693_1 [Eumeta japonica]
MGWRIVGEARRAAFGCFMSPPMRLRVCRPDYRKNRRREPSATLTDVACAHALAGAPDTDNERGGVVACAQSDTAFSVLPAWHEP